MEEKKTSPWITPFKKQCFVVLGVSLTMGQMGLVIGFSSILLPQLKMPDSPIPIDDNSGSWIAALPALTIMVGNLLIPIVMGKFGRKVAYITALLFSFAGWIGIVFSNSMTIILITRCLQGVAMGTISALGPLLIGEYSSPVNRGAFLMTISVVIGFGVLAIHTMGSYLTWKTTAIICTVKTVVNLIFAIFSPESPSWLANQGKYDECRKTFRWLRGDTEDEELEKMIESSEALRQSLKEQKTSDESLMTSIKNRVKSFVQTLMKKEFYKPFVIMIHIYAMAHWSGVNLLASYVYDFVHTAVGEDVNLPAMIISLDIQRIFSNTIAMIIIKKMKRRTMLFVGVGLNIIALLVLGVYTYAKGNSLLPFDTSYSYYVGIGLVHFLTFTIAIGALPMSFILAGELFPLQFKSMAGGVSCLFLSINIFICLKTVPFLLNTINIYGTYMLYCVLIIYFLTVVGLMLPETKDKTLQDIEEEFKGIKKPTRGCEKTMENTEV